MDIQATFYVDGIWNTFKAFKEDEEGEKDGICATGLKNNWFFGWQYYDAFAHHELEGDPRMVPEFFTDDYKRFRAKANLHRGYPLYKVKSCFGGVTAYRLQSLIQHNSTYDWSRTTEKVCEHVFLNQNLNMYVNPNMIFINEHNS
jgi:hypothetical protein